MPERLLLLILLVVAVALAITLVQGMLRRRRQHLEGQFLPVPPANADEHTGVPTVLAFSTQTCVQCKRLQTPALHTLQAELGDTVRIVHVDAIERDDLASTYKILTVPATVVLTPEGRVAALNDGFAPAAQLRQQITQALSG